LSIDDRERCGHEPPSRRAQHGRRRRRAARALRPGRPGHRGARLPRLRLLRDERAVHEGDVGKRDLKVCQRITGLPFKGQQCVKTKAPLASDPIPFTLNGASAKFTLHVTIYTKPHGAHHVYRRIADVALRFTPAK
jgi:hypothetical protein